MREYETKLLISESEYNYLVKRIGEYNNAVRQINYYYDNDLFQLNNHGITCRIREKNGEYVATIKEHHPFDECSFERTCPLGNSFDDSVFTELGYVLQGTLETHRLSWKVNDGIEIVVDKNIYLGVIDYELEVEYVFGYRSSAMEWIRLVAMELKLLGLIMDEREIENRVGKGNSKSGRFFERKLKCF